MAPRASVGLTELVPGCLDVPLLGRTGEVGHAGAGHELQTAAAPILCGARAQWHRRRVELRCRAALLPEVRFHYGEVRLRQPT